MVICLTMEHMIFRECYSFRVRGVSCPRLSVFLLPSRVTLTALILKKIYIMSAQFPTFSIMARDYHGEWREFLSSYNNQVIDKRRNMENYCQDDATALRQACGVIRREIMQIANVEDFLEDSTIASACNKMLGKQLLVPNTISLKPICSYTGKRQVQ